MKLVVVVAVVLAIAPTARAEDHGRTAVVIADVTGDALAVVPVLAKPSDDVFIVMFFGGLIGQAITAPIIHAASDDWGRAGIDLADRVGAPLVGLVLGDLICDKVRPKRSEFLRCLDGAFLGMVIGVVAAQAVDWLVLSAPTDDPATPRLVRLGFAF